jgi:hypothetical protein
MSFFAEHKIAWKYGNTPLNRRPVRCLDYCTLIFGRHLSRLNSTYRFLNISVQATGTKWMPELVDEKFAWTFTSLFYDVIFFYCKYTLERSMVAALKYVKYNWENSGVASERGIRMIFWANRSGSLAGE